MSLFLQYIEVVGDGDSPSSFTASMEQTSASCAYQILNVGTDPSFFSELTTEVLGNVVLEPQSETFSRTLPLQHGFLPCYAQSISNVRGFGMSNAGGQSFQVNATTNFPWFPQVQSYPMYPNYRFTINFTTRPYPVLPDSVIQNKSGSWVVANSGGESQSFTYVTEYERFCWLTIEPSNDAVSVQVGQLAFNATGLTSDSKPFMGQPRKMLDNSILTVHWHQVPFSYVTSAHSYLDRFRGYVNQNVITTTNLGTFQPGQLLYLNYKVTPYVPPDGLNTIFSGDVMTYQRFCNIDLVFLYTTRVADVAPLHAVSDGNYIAAGHNVLPYFGSGNDSLSGSFLYASTTPTGGVNSVPLWLSAPLEILWTNPDSADHI